MKSIAVSVYREVHGKDIMLESFLKGAYTKKFIEKNLYRERTYTGKSIERRLCKKVD